MASILKDRFLWYIVVLITVIGGLAFNADLPILGSLAPSADWELAYTNVLRVLYLGTVAMATWRFGTKGGLVAYLIIVIIGLPYTIGVTQGMWRPHLLLELGIMATIGLAFIWLIGQQKKGKRLLEQTAEELKRRADSLNREITERKRAEEKLHELGRMKAEFISRISHELRTPLHSSLGFTKLIRGGKVPDHKTQVEFLTIIGSQGAHLGKLIDDLLDVSRLESGRFEVRKQLLSVKKPIHEAIHELYGLASEKGIVISENMPATLPSVEADGERLRQVMTNLLSNAIKFSPDGGEIIVKAEDRDNDLLLQVIDHGVGIPEKAIPHLFERFYQVESPMTRSVGGSGLGLYITKQIIEAHGGLIEVESKVHKGSTFYFTIPKPSRQKIGELLVGDGLISQQDLEEALKKQKGEG